MSLGVTVAVNVALAVGDGTTVEVGSGELVAVGLAVLVGVGVGVFASIAVGVAVVVATVEVAATVVVGVKRFTVALAVGTDIEVGATPLGEGSEVAINVGIVVVSSLTQPAIRAAVAIQEITTTATHKSLDLTPASIHDT